MANEMNTVLFSLTLLGLVAVSLANVEGGFSCDNVTCQPGYSCVLQQVYCFRAPCHDIATCVRRVGGGTKPGDCPRRRPGFVGPCVVRCFGDNSCPGNQKCCGGCPTACATPVFRNTVKPGHCPPRLLGGFRGAWCRSAPSEVCTKDYDCDGSLKCCDNGCHSLCTRPYSYGDESGQAGDESGQTSS